MEKPSQLHGEESELSPGGTEHLQTRLRVSHQNSHLG